MARRRVIRFHTLAEAMRRLFTDAEIGTILAALDGLAEAFEQSAARSTTTAAAWVMGRRVAEVRALAERIHDRN